MEPYDRWGGVALGETGTSRIGRATAWPPAMECHLSLIRAGLLAEWRVAEILRPFGLSCPGFNVLTVVSRAGEPLSPCVISSRLVVPRNTLTHILDVLERQDLVRRERHPHHRGMVLVDLTDAGRATLDAILPRLHALESEIWSSFSEEERQTLVLLLARVEEAFERKDPGCGQRAG